LDFLIWILKNKQIIEEKDKFVRNFGKGAKAQSRVVG
jgi:hypothetical protein